MSVRRKDFRRVAVFVAMAGLLASVIPTAIQARSASRLLGGEDKFAVTSEKAILEIPGLYRPGQSLSFAALSPDGRSVLIVKAGRLTVRPLESGDEEELLPQGAIATVGNEAWAAWAADEKCIYYLRLTNRPGIADLWRLDLASRRTTRLIENAGGVVTSPPKPSPDGKSIAFFRGKTLLLATADRQSERVLWQDGESTKWPDVVWSPDGSQILVPALSQGLLKLNLVTVTTGQVRPLKPWRGRIISIVWPSWSSGPFLCASALSARWNEDSVPVRQIWHLTLPQDERIPVTADPVGYSKIFGAGASGYSLVVQRNPPRASLWELTVDFLATLGPGQHGFGTGIPPPAGFQPTVLLILRK
jgi:dipeptidyl aminopeptidase/acylaminoacyl peptidase